MKINQTIKLRLIFIAILTIFVSIFFTVSTRNELKTVNIKYSDTSSFNINDIVSTFTKTEKELFDSLREDGLSLYVEESNFNILASEYYIDIYGEQLMETFIKELYDIELTTLDNATPITDAQLHITNKYGLSDDYYYNNNASISNSLYVYSHSQIPENIYTLIKSGEEIEIITSEKIYNYLQTEFGETLNVKLADIYGDCGISGDNFLSSDFFAECDNYNSINDLYQDNNYSDYLYIFNDSQYDFAYNFAHNNLLNNADNNSILFDTQYLYTGAISEDYLSLFNKMFNQSFFVEYKKYIMQLVYADIVVSMIQDYDIQNSATLETFLNTTDTIYIGVYDGYYPLGFDVNDNGNMSHEGYYVELFRYYELLLESFNINIEFISYSDANFDASLYDNLIYTNFYNTEEFVKDYLYSSHYVDNEYRIVSKNDATKMSSIIQLNGKIAFPTYLMNYYHFFNIIGEENIVLCDTNVECQSLLDKGKVDYLLISSMNLEYLLDFDVTYYTNLMFAAEAAHGYYTVSNSNPNAEYLLELVDILYPTIDHDSVLRNVTLTYETYLINYKAANQKSSFNAFVIVLYLITVLGIIVSLLLRYRREKTYYTSQINELIRVTNVGIVLIVVKTSQVDGSVIKQRTLLVSYNVVKILEISKYTFIKERNLYEVDTQDYLNTIKTYVRVDGNKITYFNDTEITLDFLIELSVIGDLTLQHVTEKTKTERYIEYSITSKEGLTQRTLTAMARDITGMFNQNKVLADLAYTDALTGLGNITKLRNDINTSSFAHYITINISNFRVINDTYSTQFADELLKKFSTSLQEILCGNNNAYRLVADNFIVLSKVREHTLINDQIKKIKEQCSKIQVTATESINIEILFTVSEFYKEKYNSHEQFMLEVSIKTKLGKADGDYFVSDKQYQQFNISQNIQSEVYKLTNFENFEIYLQPKVNPFTNKCVGAEALIRWIHPKHGIVPPLSFLDKFEKLKRMFSLDNFVLEQTCLAFNQLKSKNLIDDNFLLSFNLSAHTVIEHDFSKMIIDTLDKHNVPYKNIELEILESLDLSVHGEISNKFETLHDLGISIAIDDYGSGYANVNTVTMLPYAKLKFDKSLADNIDSDDKKQGLFKNLVNMHDILGHKILTEGVETLEQLEIIKKQGISEVQGYFYSEPLSISEFENFIIKFNNIN